MIIAEMGVNMIRRAARATETLVSAKTA